MNPLLASAFVDELEKLAAPISAREMSRAAGRLGGKRLRGIAEEFLGAINPTRRQARSWGDKPNPISVLMPDSHPMVQAFNRQIQPGQIGISSVKKFRSTGPALFGRPITKAEARAQRHFTLLHEAEERKIRKPTFDVLHASIGVLLREKRLTRALAKKRGALKTVGGQMEHIRRVTGEERIVLDKLRKIDPRLVPLYEAGQLSGAARRFVERRLQNAPPISKKDLAAYQQGMTEYVMGNLRL